MTSPLNNHPNLHIDQVDLAIKDSLVGSLRKNRQVLSSFPEVSTFPNERAYNVIKLLFQEPESDLDVKVMAAILSAVVYEQKAVFLLSRDGLENIVRDCPNIKRSTLNGSENRKLMNKLLARMRNGEVFLKCLVPPTQGLGRKNEAGLYTLSCKSFTDLLEWWPTEEQLGEITRSLAHLFTPNSTPYITPIISPNSTPKGKDKAEYKLEAEVEYKNTNVQKDSTETPLPEAGLSNVPLDYWDRLRNIDDQLLDLKNRQSTEEVLQKYFLTKTRAEEYISMPLGSRTLRCSMILAKEKNVLPPQFQDWIGDEPFDVKKSAVKDLGNKLYACLVKQKRIEPDES